jgi:hypothetical protein
MCEIFDVPLNIVYGLFPPPREEGICCEQGI